MYLDPTNRLREALNFMLEPGLCTEKRSPIRASPAAGSYLDWPGDLPVSVACSAKEPVNEMERAYHDLPWPTDPAVSALRVAR
jgi:hypothetical protein